MPWYMAILVRGAHVDGFLEGNRWSDQLYRLIKARDAEACRELASDTTADNAKSVEAHRALEFEDVGLVRCFRKSLESTA